MEDQNIIIFLDKIKKLLELGNKPKAIAEIEVIMVILQNKIAKKNGKLFRLITIPQQTEATDSTLRDFELAHKVNEIITFLNERYSHD